MQRQINQELLNKLKEGAEITHEEMLADSVDYDFFKTTKIFRRYRNRANAPELVDDFTNIEFEREVDYREIEPHNLKACIKEESEIINLAKSIIEQSKPFSMIFRDYNNYKEPCFVIVAPPFAIYFFDRYAHEVDEDKESVLITRIGSAHFVKYLEH